MGFFFNQITSKDFFGWNQVQRYFLPIDCCGYRQITSSAVYIANTEGIRLCDDQPVRPSCKLGKRVYISSLSLKIAYHSKP